MMCRRLFVLCLTLQIIVAAPSLLNRNDAEGNNYTYPKPHRLTDQSPFFIYLNNKNPLEPETFMTTVITRDGYILSLHRIPFNDTDQSTPRIPILVTNLIPYGSSSYWVMNRRANSLGFVLSDAGFDVWLSDYRGGEYSQQHRSLQSCSTYWDFSLDDISKHDLPSLIDYITKITDHKRIFLVSTSFGTIVPLMTFATQPEYNEKVMGHVTLSGVWKFSPAIHNTVLRRVIRVGMNLKPIFSRILVGQVALSPGFSRFLGGTIGYYLPKFNYIIGVSSGSSAKTVNTTRTPVFLGQSGPQNIHTSLRSIIHLLQILGEGGNSARYYDYGRNMNKKIYLQNSPPEYRLTNITVPTLLVTVPKDWIIGIGEAKMIHKQMKSISTILKISRKDYTHDHYAIATDANEVVFKHVIRFMQNIYKHYET